MLLVLVATVLLGVSISAAMLLTARSAPPVSVDAPVGASDEGYTVWARNRDGTPVRWDPCTPIVIEVSAVGAPVSYPAAAFLTDVETAAQVLVEVTGLDLVVTGTSEQVPDGTRSAVTHGADGDRRWAPVLIGWRDPGAGGFPMRDVDRGVAVPVAVGPPGARVYVTAQVALNPERTDLLPGTADRATSWGATVLHELAHVLGLGHVDDPDQMMHTFPGRGPVVLGEGDLAGLHAIGAAGGCLAVPPPRELEVDLPDP